MGDKNEDGRKDEESSRGDAEARREKPNYLTAERIEHKKREKRRRGNLTPNNAKNRKDKGVSRGGGT
jgi:hypothetical protein